MPEKLSWIQWMEIRSNINNLYRLNNDSLLWRLKNTLSRALYNFFLSLNWNGKTLLLGYYANCLLITSSGIRRSRIICREHFLEENTES